MSIEVKYQIFDYYNAVVKIDDNCKACGTDVTGPYLRPIKFHVPLVQTVEPYYLGYTCGKCGHVLVAPEFVAVGDINGYKNKANEDPATIKISPQLHFGEQLHFIAQGRQEAYGEVIKFLGCVHGVHTLENVVVALEDDRNSMSISAICLALTELDFPTYLTIQVGLSQTKLEALRMLRLYLLTQQNVHPTASLVEAVAATVELNGPMMLGAVHFTHHVVPPHKTKINAAEAHLIFNEHYIAAIKELRTRTGLGLKEAKDVIDAYKAALA